MAGELARLQEDMLVEVIDRLVDHEGTPVVLEPAECDALTRALARHRPEILLART